MRAACLSVFFIAFFAAGSLCGQSDYYFDRQQKRIFIFSQEEARRAVHFNTLIPIEQSSLNWLVNQKQPSGLVESYEGAKVSYTYDDSLAVLCYCLYGSTAEARSVLDFYKKEMEKDLKGKKGFAGFADMYLVSGKTGNSSCAIGPNAWLLLALNYYTVKTSDRSYLDMARALADWMMTYRNSHNGGLWGGKSGSGAPFFWMSTEHNLDAYAALLGLFRLTGEARYREAALKIKTWLMEEMREKGSGRFYNGQDDPTFATDVSSWSVLSLADTALAPCLDFAVKFSENRQYYAPNRIEVTGFDFGSSYARSPYPDKDAVWFEGTGQMVLAFALLGRTNEARYYTEELKKAVVKSGRHDDSTGLPYASNPGSPPYGGWTMPDRPVCVSSTAWFLMALKNFNPFHGLVNRMEEISRLLPAGPAEERKETKPSPVDKKENVKEKEKEKEKEKTGQNKKVEEELFGE